MKPPLPRLHAITDDSIARRLDVADVARQIATAAGGEIALHARGHTLTGLEHYELAGRLAVGPSGRLFVNDRLDVALAAAAAGVQLTARSLPVSAARRLSAAWWIGKSVHDLDEAEAARAEGADYLVVGPVYATPTHPEGEPLGLEPLRRIARLGKPVIAIGGVTPERARAARAAGAYGVAAIRALWDAPDPAAAARAMLEAVQ
ncbi:MAG: thiamine phosphate synthase [Gemmatimonadales bacterium]